MAFEGGVVSRMLSLFEGPFGAFFFLEQRGVPTWLYWAGWGVLSFGVWALLYRQVRALTKGITMATEQNLVRMVMDSRLFYADHPDLVDRHPDPVVAKFIDEMGGMPKYFLRRNIVSTLEMAYFHRKAGATDKQMFVSYCNFTRPFFQIPAFAATWEKTRAMHTPEFAAFVDGLLKKPAAEIDPWKPVHQRIRDYVTDMFHGCRDPR
jgi:hypothetical protein